MIASIYLRNILSHKKTLLEFSPGVNVIWGLPESGKTSIFRAFNWLRTNRVVNDRGNTVSVDNIISKWGGGSLVRVDMVKPSYKFSIERIKESSFNGYKLITDDDTEEFVATSGLVPKEISKTLSIDDINVKAQEDSYFLLSNSPGQVAKVFNSIAGLQDIDTAQSNIKGIIRSLEQNIKHEQLEVEKAKTHLDGYVDLEEAESDFEQLQMKQKLCKDIEQRLHASRRIQNSFIILKGKYEKYKEIEYAENAFARIVVLEGEVRVVKDAYKEKVQLLEKSKKLRTRKEELYNKIKVLEKKFEKIMPEICPLCNQRVGVNHALNPSPGRGRNE